MLPFFMGIRKNAREDIILPPPNTPVTRFGVDTGL